MKRVPADIHLYLTPLTLAVMIMGCGTRVSTGMKLSVPFSYDDCRILTRALSRVFGLAVTINSAGYNLPNGNGECAYCIYV